MLQYLFCLLEYNSHFLKLLSRLTIVIPLALISFKTNVSIENNFSRKCANIFEKRVYFCTGNIIVYDLSDYPYQL